ncbi:sulfotransferase [Sphingobium sp. AN558]|uniref:sulfotransferase family protein n=1 Tax=Sphingobium sp. AN558 TaxID=3133442 RepID=UPI0030BB89A7
MIVDTLRSRFEIDRWLDQHPEALAKPIYRPLFIIGMPRAGTTMLLNILRHDPARRVYWNWEANHEIPPAMGGELQSDPRIAMRIAEIDSALECGFLDRRHHVEQGDEPAECVFPMARDFKSYIWLVTTQVPKYFEWLLNEADMEAAYRHHRRSLQLMQTNAPGNWTLKWPTHAAWTDALLKVYPDARFVVTHRDPVKPIGSTCSAVRHAQAFNNDGIDPNYIGYETSTLVARMAENMMRTRDANPHVPFHDLHYKALVADPIRAIRSIYDFLGEHLSPAVEARMQQEVDEQNASRKVHGPHVYNLCDYGLSRVGMNTMFREYVDRFGIAREAD